MSSKSENDWQDLFDSLPVDSNANDTHSRSAKEQALKAYSAQAESGGQETDEDLGRP